MTQFIVFTCDYRYDGGGKCGERFWGPASAMPGEADAAARAAGWRFFTTPLVSICPRHVAADVIPLVPVHVPFGTLPSNVTPIRKR